MRINHNIQALNTYNKLTANNSATAKSLEKLSSGLKINKAGDDAAGLAISEKMRSQVRGLDTASRNASDGISLIQTAEGALSETHSILQRMKELATQAANGTNTDSDRAEIQKEINQLTSEVNRIGNTTEFNTQKLLNGGSAGVAEASAMAGGADAVTQQAAIYTFTPSAQFDVGESISFIFEGKSITLTGVAENGAGNDNTATTFEIGTDVATQTAHLAAAITAAFAGGTPTTGYTVAATATTVTITANDGGAKDGLAGSNQLSGFSVTTDGETATFSETTVGRDAANAAAATGTITFNNNMLSAGTSIVINDETFVLYDSNKGGIAPTAANHTGIDIASMTSPEDLIDAIVAQDAAVADVGLSKTATNVLTITADATGGAGNAYALSVTGPAGQTNTYNTNLQIGANKGQSMTLEVNDMRSQALGVSSLAGTGTTVTINGNTYDVAWSSTKAVTNGTDDVASEAGLSVANHADASKAIEVLSASIDYVSTERSKLGAYQNRLEHTINNVGTSSENLSAAESRIRDVDMAKEMMEFTKNNILSQAAQAMLAQANQQPQSVLQLLQ